MEHAWIQLRLNPSSPDVNAFDVWANHVGAWGAPHHNLVAAWITSAAGIHPIQLRFGLCGGCEVCRPTRSSAGGRCPVIRSWGGLGGTPTTGAFSPHAFEPRSY